MGGTRSAVNAQFGSFMASSTLSCVEGLLSRPGRFGRAQARPVSVDEAAVYAAGYLDVKALTVCSITRRGSGWAEERRYTILPALMREARNAHEHIPPITFG